MKKQRNCKILAACMITCLSVGGCQWKDSPSIVETVFPVEKVFEVGGEVCTLPEAKVILTNYQNMYATMYGIDLWGHGLEGNDLETYVKDLTVARLAQIMAMDQLAQEKGISLDEEELDKIKEASEAYFNSLNDAEKAYMDVAVEDIETLYRRYGLANKLYTYLTEGVDHEVSDDEARIMEAQQIFVSEKSTSKEVSEQLKSGADFLSVASVYNEEAETEVTFGRNDVPKEVEEEAFSLENDQVSGRIRTEEGYYFIKCINHFNQEKTDVNKSVILEKRRKEAFDGAYLAFLDTLPSGIYEDTWDAVQVKVQKDVKTDSFFEVYEQYCGW